MLTPYDISVRLSAFRRNGYYFDDISVLKDKAVRIFIGIHKIFWIKYLEGGSSPSKNMKDIAASHNISISHYERLFRNDIGISPVEYRNIHKINCIKAFLHDAEITLDEISEKMGYCDSSYLCRFFKRQTGMTPKEYRNIYISQTMTGYGNVKI